MKYKLQMMKRQIHFDDPSGIGWRLKPLTIEELVGYSGSVLCSVQRKALLPQRLRLFFH